jgi:hypothetical protein
VKKEYVKPELGNPEQTRFEDVYNCHFNMTWMPNVIEVSSGYWIGKGRWRRWVPPVYGWASGCYTVACANS